MAHEHLAFVKDDGTVWHVWYYENKDGLSKMVPLSERPCLEPEFEAERAKKLARFKEVSPVLA